MREQLEHVRYTREEWTTVPSHIEIINYLANKNIQIVADIGANVGECTKIFLERIASIKTVYAYEPRYDNFEFLKTTFLSEQRVKPIRKGIFYGKTASSLYFNGGSGSSTIVDVGSQRSREIGRYTQEYIDLVELENEGIEKLDLIKLDVEGAEYNIIQNSSLLKLTKYLILEFHHFGMNDTDKFLKDLPPCGSITDNTVRTDYIKAYTDMFIKLHLPDHKMIVEDTCQYLLERNVNV